MKDSPDLHLAFDVGHSSIGWAVLQSPPSGSPALLGCGAVIFPTDDCLASQRRQFRRQRRHIRATRLRIARMKRLFAHLGVLDEKQLGAPGCAWPWLLAARVLRGGSKLTWSELWDVLRWYAHNRGYDGNKGWSRQDAAANAEDTEKEQKAHELLDAFRAKHGRDGTMVEVFCDRLGLDPLAEKKASTVRFRDLGAAFPREGVEAEVERILHAQGVEENVIVALMRDHTAVAGPDYRLPARYGQRVNGARTPGGLLFGQLVPRFENRIIATCPVQFQRVYDLVFSETKDAAKATHEAEKHAKVPSIACPEFHRFRWAMQLANVTVAIGDARKTRRLTKEQRNVLNTEMEKHGALTPTEFKKAVRALTGTNKDNLDRLLALPDADKSLVLDPARKLAASGALGVLWPHLSAPLQKHTLTNLRRGKAVTARALLAQAPQAQAAFGHWWDGEAMKKPRKQRKGEAPVERTRDSALDEPHSLGPMNGRAAHSREVMDEVWKFVLSGDGHPMDPDAPLFRSEAIRRAQLERAIEEQTNNHLVRHRLRILVGETDKEAARHPKQPRLNGLFRDLVDQYAGGDKARVERITIEVNRNLKELSGKTAQEQAKEQGQQTFQFRSVEKKLTAAYEGLGVRLGPGLIRKGRIAEDLGWKCPYTGASYDEVDLLHRRADKDHIIPRSQRASDSLDSLVITFAEINKWKGNRTAVQFVAEEESKPVPGRPNVTMKTLTHFLKDVDALDTFKGHDDDQRRKKNRQRLLKLRDYVEKEFTPGDLTKTSQLVRLGAEALQRAYLDAKEKPVIVSLPGSVTAAARKSWNLAGCLAAANPNVLNPEDLDENGKPKVHRKTELRGITHLHHALDASIIAFTSHLLPCDGGAWKREIVELLSKRECKPAEQTLLRALLRGNVSFAGKGQPMLGELPKELREQLRTRLAERRVVQHLPAEMSGMRAEQNAWRVVKVEGDMATLRQRMRQPDGTRTAKPEKKEKVSKLVGLMPGKLKRLQAALIIADNFGLALDPEPTIIPHHHVWKRLAELKAKNGGKPARVLRNGMLINLPRGKHPGVWRVFSLKNAAAGILLDLGRPDVVRLQNKTEGHRINVMLSSLLRDGMHFGKTPLTGAVPDSL